MTTPTRPAGPDPGRTEATGARFSLRSMQTARALAQLAVRRIASGMHPGMTHAQAHDLAMATLHKLEMERNWHPVVIRFDTHPDHSVPAAELATS